MLGGSKNPVTLKLEFTVLCTEEKLHLFKLFGRSTSFRSDILVHFLSDTRIAVFEVFSFLQFSYLNMFCLCLKSLCCSLATTLRLVTSVTLLCDHQY